MRRWAKKPKILSLKREVADLILKKLEKVDYCRHPRGYYWTGVFKYGDTIIYVYLQMYVRGRVGVNYVRIRNGSNELTKTQLLEIKEKLNGKI